MSVLVCENITKINQDHNSIKSFNYNFLESRIYAILGKSNSGKGALLNLLSGKDAPDSGVIYLDGKVLKKNSNLTKRLCYISKDHHFSSVKKVKDIFVSMNKHFPKWDNYYAYELLDYFGIDANSSYGALLEHQKRLLHCIIGLSSLANITIFDETINFADIKDRYDFYRFVYEHHQKYPRTIIICNDYIDEIDYMFDKILFLDRGKLIETFTIEELKNNFRYLSGKSEVLKSLISGIKVIGVEQRSNTLLVCVHKKITKDELRKFQKYLIKISEVPIEKIFIYLVNLKELKEKNSK